MNDNSILKELRQTRQRLLEPFGGNVTAYLRDLQHRQKELCAGHQMVRHADELIDMNESPNHNFKDEPLPETDADSNAP
jgi:hypothetical protein